MGQRWPYAVLMRYVAFHDLVAGLATLLLLLGIFMLLTMGRDVPAQLWTSFSAVLSWAVRGGVQAANDYSHSRRTRNDNAPTG